MSDTIEAWYKEKIKDTVNLEMQDFGGHLDGTMVSGDEQAGVVKFPIAGRANMYKLSGAIERVPTGNVGLSTIKITTDDYESTEWWRTQDAMKAGPNEQAALIELITGAKRRKRDGLKWTALHDFSAVADTEVTHINAPAVVPDLLHFERARAEIAGAGSGPGGAGNEVFCPIPEMWSSQLKFYKEYSDAQWVGPENTPFSKTQRMTMRTTGGITYIVCPDEFFGIADATTEVDTFMWAKKCMGAEMVDADGEVDISKQEMMQGSPYLVKGEYKGAAVGILGKGVKKITLKRILEPVRPA